MGIFDFGFFIFDLESRQRFIHGLESRFFTIPRKGNFSPRPQGRSSQ
jgi:hypothetical protein